MFFELNHPSTCLVVGATQVGKSFLVRKMIRENVYGSKIKRVRWCYLYPPKWMHEEPDIEFIRGLPSTFETDDLIILDDHMHRLNEKVAEIFTVVSHQCGISVILLLQNLFPRNPVMRDISLNSHYIILFKNSRDKAQFRYFGRQVYPENTKYFLDAYIKATKKQFSYLVVDLHPQTEEEYRLRESLFPTPPGLYWLYLPE